MRPAGGRASSRHHSSSRAAGKAAVQRRSDVKQQCGLEVPRQLRWHTWHADGEFVKVLAVKNVSGEVVVFSYRLLPGSCAFSVPFPDAFKLSPGMSASIKVCFRPRARVSHTAALELTCGGSVILVPLEAVLPASKLQLPARLDFGLVPAKEAAALPLPVHNVGDATLAFRWSIAPPFAVLPEAGTLAPGQAATCEVRFEPQEAAAYEASAACSLDNGELLTVQLAGMAKVPFVSLETQQLDMGHVTVGAAAEACVRFGNHSAVPARFSIQPAGGSDDGAFSIQPSHGVLQPNEYSLLRVSYAPRATGTFSCQRFCLATRGGNRLQLSCQGVAAGPALRLSARVFAFGCVRAGAAPPPQLLTLENESDVPLAYEFQVEPHGVFGLSRPCGTLPPRGCTRLALCFRALAPGNYWQRIVCLVKDAAPLAIDALATCYGDDTSRPPTLTDSHVSAYVSSLAAGGAAAPADVRTTSAATAAGTSSDAGAGSTLGAAASSTVQQAQQQAQQAQQARQAQLVGPDSWPLLFEGLGASPPVSVSESVVEFGSCSNLSAPQPRSFTVTNNTAAKLLVALHVPGWQDPLGLPDKHVRLFQAFPEAFELRPHSSATVRLAFRPPCDGAYFSQSLLLLASLKSMRSFRLVPEGTAVVPPWCITLQACGDTFAGRNPELSPKVALSSSAIAFPPCRPGDASYATLALANNGDAPVHFMLTPAQGGNGGGGGGVAGLAVCGPFALLPSQGVLEPKSSRLVALRFRPSVLGPAQLALACTFNRTAANSSTLLLSGEASEPALAWDVPAGGRLFFPPTCIGACSQRCVKLTNVSRVPVGWRWQLSRKLQGAVTLHPESGVLRGFESASVTVTFSPPKQQLYEARAALLMLSPEAVATAAGSAAAAEAAAGKDDGVAAEQQQEAADAADKKLIVTLVAEATQGALSIEPSAISLGAVRVGHPQRQVLRLVNHSSGMLQYSVQLQADGPHCSGGSSAGEAACEFGIATAALLASSRAGGSSAAGSGAAAGSRPPELLADCWVDEPEGCIYARASKTLTLTLLPRRRSDYTLSLHLHAKSGSQQPGLTLISPAAASAAGGGTAARPPLATAVVSAIAAFPSLLLTDVHCHGLPKQVAWQMLGVQRLNAELCSPVSCAELQARALADKGLLTNDNAAALLPPFELDLGVLAVGAAPRAAWLRLSNAGALPVAWELHSYDKPEVELERWVEPAKPLSPAEQARAFIIDHAIFGVQPHSTELQPGQPAEVCITFNPAAEGEFQLPLFLCIADGKQLQLQLRGRAVQAAAQVPLALPGSQSCVFAATPIGELQPPLQSYLLRNGGPGPLQYRLDTSPLQQLASQNYCAEIIQYAGGSPLQGEVAPGDVAVFNWLFQPLEARVYSAALPLSIGGAPPQPLLLRGRGFHPLQQPEQAEPTQEEAALCWRSWTGFSPSPQLQPPGRVLGVSAELLPLGTCLPASTAKRLLLLHNSASVPLQFAWQLGVFCEERRTISGRLLVVPAAGVLQPGETLACQVVFQAGLQPQLFSGEISCWGRAADAGAAASMPSSNSRAACSMQQQGQEQDEEVIAMHPARCTELRQSRLDARLPLHLSMTQSTCSKFEPLRQRFMRTLSQQPGATQQQAAGEAPWAAVQQVPEQLAIVTVQGAVLAHAHVQAASSYLPAAERQDALKLLAVADLLPPAVQQPVCLLPPPGSMGPSAAAARAAAAASCCGGPQPPAAPPLALAHEIPVLNTLLADALSAASAQELVADAAAAALQAGVQVQQQQRGTAAAAARGGDDDGCSGAAAELLAQPQFVALADEVLDSVLLRALRV